MEVCFYGKYYLNLKMLKKVNMQTSCKPILF